MLTDSVRKAIQAQIDFVDRFVPLQDRWEASKKMTELMDLWCDVGCALKAEATLDDHD